MKKIIYLTIAVLSVFITSCNKKSEAQEPSNDQKLILHSKNFDFIDSLTFGNYYILGFNDKKQMTSFIEVYDKNNKTLVYKSPINEFEIQNNVIHNIDNNYFYYDSGITYLGARSNEYYSFLLDMNKLVGYNLHIVIEYDCIVYVDSKVPDEILNKILNLYDVTSYKRISPKNETNI
jgi:hypothetical protein